MAYRDKRSIRNGRITLYRRTSEGSRHQSDSWYAAFKLPGQKTLRRSLKTTDEREAEDTAEAILFDLTQRSKKGLSLTSKRFELVCNHFLKDYEKRVEGNLDQLPRDQKYKPKRLTETRKIIEKYLAPYFGDKLLHDISDFDIDSYKEFRRTYWITGPGAQDTQITYLRNGRPVNRPKNSAETKEPSFSTINKELTVLRKIFDHARMLRLIEGSEIPTIQNVSKPRNNNGKKPGLTEMEVKQLLSAVVDNYHETKTKNPKHGRHQKLILHYISFMCLTGLRVAEAKNLTFNDCSIHTKGGKKYLKIFVWGKGKSRELIGLNESITALKKLKLLHKENAKTHAWKFSEDMHVFVDQYSNQVGSFRKGLDAAFERAGLLTDAHGIKRTAGAFRKYYITQALLEGNVNYFELAKQCGTSVSTIEKFYAEIDVTRKPEQFIFDNALTGVYEQG